ncbi:indolepyruvate ferredoxin oxidoreductase family protein [Variovorax paradoxus]|nr:indolepyruvate ferredoxin oxidoreductase family protein [Variovorax paradoxus]
MNTAIAHAEATLEDKYTKPHGRVFMTGTQALVRLLLAQKTRDAAAGLRTGGFVSGYRGSPLGAVDQELWKARKHLDAAGIVFQPGLNEELAATALWGTQMVGLDPNATGDGVFGMWYGKGPGVDRSGDVFKHANLAGTARHGGVLAIVGDDHTCKSSTLAHQSEHALIAAMIPILNPSGVAEFVELGLHGWALSRWSGCWVAMKSISETIETTSSFDIDPAAIETRIPAEVEVPAPDFSLRWPDAPLDQEKRLVQQRMRAVLGYVRANGLNRQPWDVADAHIGIVSTGKSWLDTLDALALLGIDEAIARRIGLRLLKIAVTWPLEPEGVQDFSRGLSEILVVEEKRPIVESQIKELLYDAPPGARPRVLGKSTGAGEWASLAAGDTLLPVAGELTPAMIAKVIAARLVAGIGPDALPEQGRQWLAAQEAHGIGTLDATLPQRLPFFCSGCPHNTSTKVPEGSRATAGIGCHFMATWMDRSTSTFTQMGGEGASWLGQMPFTGTRHIFVNLGDGTYNHSGSLAIRAALAAKANVTYKILANDAIAMTGGQPIEGALDAVQILRQVAAEGVRTLHLVSDEPHAWIDRGGLPAGAVVSHRDRMDRVQRELREQSGVSVIVYAQTCAAEKRRRRKKKELIDPPRRVVIHDEVCEGCGDCGVKSNCVSIVPLETPLGRKRTIDQSACNKDYSCTQGFCPSFVTIEGGQRRKPQKQRAAVPTGLPAPTLPALDHPYNILVTGVGGTGVVTVGALMGMAAHLEGKGVVILDMAGVAQKGGAVTSHVRIAAHPRQVHGARVGSGQADLLLGCDLMVAAGKEGTGVSDRCRTTAIVNTDVAPTGAFARDTEWQGRPADLLEQVRRSTATTVTIDASRLAQALMGDAVATNVFMLGFAWQKGLVPLGEAALKQAIELNGAAVPMNLAAFAWGRQAVVDEARARAAAGLSATASVIAMPARTPSLEALLADRVQRLEGYQNASYASLYRSFVERIAAAENARTGGDRVAREVAVSLYKLMAYKDEYEVARLYVDSGFLGRIENEFEDDYRLRFHLAPPLLARRDAKGQPLKRTFGPWIATAFRLLTRLKGLRGTPFDIFGWTAERRIERALLGEYQALMEGVIQRLDAGNRQDVLALARLPQSVRGFGHVKLRNLAAARTEQEKLLARLDAPLTDAARRAA